MMRWVATFLLVFTCFFRGLGQERTGSIQGRIADSSLERGCALVVVAILNNDSSIVRFTRTKKDGTWAIRGIPAGDYLVLTTHPAYDDYMSRIVIKEDSITDMGVIYLQPKSDSLA